ncbi:MAG: hypothetical protein AAF517_08645 [Planctomycetota bacterium]
MTSEPAQSTRRRTRTLRGVIALFGVGALVLVAVVVWPRFRVWMCLQRIDSAKTREELDLVSAEMSTASEWEIEFYFRSIQRSESELAEMGLRLEFAGPGMSTTSRQAWFLRATPKTFVLFDVLRRRKLAGKLADRWTERLREHPNVPWGVTLTAFLDESFLPLTLEDTKCEVKFPD